MCRRNVVVDTRGRCPLGHQVLPLREVEQRAVDRGDVRESAVEDAAARAADPEAAGRVVATYIEPRTSSPVLQDPPPHLPLGTVDGTAAPASAFALMIKPALGEGGGRAEDDGDPSRTVTRSRPDDLVDDVGGPTQMGVHRRVVDAHTGRAVIPRADLTPWAPSALDLVADTWASASIPADTVYEQEPEGDTELPRGVGRMVAGGVFVAVLFAIAWYLATNI